MEGLVVGEMTWTKQRGKALKHYKNLQQHTLEMNKEICKKF